jgi:perosamine synthetase
MAEALKYKYPRAKSIIVPGNVYVAAWNCFKMSTNFKFDVVDCDVETWNASYDNLNQKEEKRIALIVHNIGNIINVPSLKEKFPSFIFLEDNCEGFLGKYNNMPSGSESWLSSVSFFGNKTVTSGEGGALFTNDEEISEYLQSVSCQGITSKKFIFDKLGYNYRMTNIQAAILYGQLKSIEEITEKKHLVFEKYKKELAFVKEINIQKQESGTTHSNWMFGIRFPEFSYNNLKELELYLYHNDIETRPIFPPINFHKHYSYIKTSLPNCKRVFESSLILPSYPELESNEIEYICNAIKKFLSTKSSKQDI